MTQSVLIKNIEHLLSINVISESDLAEALNTKLAENGISLIADGSAKITKRTAKGKAKNQPKKVEGSRGQRTVYADKRNNFHAILLAVKKCGEKGGDSAAIKEQLKEMDHVMANNVFNTTKSNLANEHECLKGIGKARSKVFTLTKVGEAELERYESVFKEKGAS